jgi:UPF0271 protein
MGESRPWTDDAALLDIVTGYQFAAARGDADVMAATMTLAHQTASALARIPAYMDIAGFGRNRISMPRATLQSQTVRWPQVRHGLNRWAQRCVT